jgi:hypothetical protein
MKGCICTREMISSGGLTLIGKADEFKNSLIDEEAKEPSRADSPALSGLNFDDHFQDDKDISLCIESNLKFAKACSEVHSLREQATSDNGSITSSDMNIFCPNYSHWTPPSCLFLLPNRAFMPWINWILSKANTRKLQVSPRCGCKLCRKQTLRK